MGNLYLIRLLTGYLDGDVLHGEPYLVGLRVVLEACNSAVVEVYLLDHSLYVLLAGLETVEAELLPDVVSHEDAQSLRRSAGAPYRPRVVEGEVFGVIFPAVAFDFNVRYSLQGSGDYTLRENGQCCPDGLLGVALLASEVAELTVYNLIDHLQCGQFFTVLLDELPDSLGDTLGSDEALNTAGHVRGLGNLNLQAGILTLFAGLSRYLVGPVYLALERFKVSLHLGRINLGHFRHPRSTHRI